MDSCGAYMAATLDVTTLSYLPYAVFNFASPLLTIALAYAGVRMLRGEAAGLAHYASLSSTALAMLLLWCAPIWES